MDEDSTVNAPPNPTGTPSLIEKTQQLEEFTDLK